MANSISLAVGGVQPAAADYRRQAADDPSDRNAWRLLGLCDLSRALNDDGSSATRLQEWWRRALAELLPALYCDNFWSERCLRRGLVYERTPDEEHFQQSRERVVQHLHQLLSHQKRAFEQKPDRTEAVAAIDGLSADLHSEEMRYQLLRELRGPSSARSASVLFPFGLLWYQREGAPLAAQTALSECLSTASTELRGNRRKTAEELRQWFSRLSPVKHALRWGQMSVAEAALQRICLADGDCRPGAGSLANRTHASPKCCDAQCERFAYCNPGYLGVDQPGAGLERDAHRLALEVTLGRVRQCLKSGRHQLLEAAQYWHNAALLAETLGESDEICRRIADEALDFIDAPTVSSDYGIEILSELLRAVPTPRIKGRLADRLLNMGIDRHNHSQWMAAIAYLQRALELNPHLDRGYEPLLAAFCHATLEALQSGGGDLARELQSETDVWRNKALQRSVSLENLAALLSLAEDACRLLG